MVQLLSKGNLEESGVKMTFASWSLLVISVSLTLLCVPYSVVRSQEKGGRDTSQIAMSASVRPDGKYFVVQLFGSSGSDLPKSGSINISVSKGSTLADVSGNFTGLPCDIELVGLENVSDASLIEYPGPTNQWTKAVVRVRPKDTKKAVRFAINFRLRESSPP
jgi:hypothetical protein